MCPVSDCGFEIYAAIASWLEQADLARCCLVNTTWCTPFQETLFSRPIIRNHRRWVKFRDVVQDANDPMRKQLGHKARRIEFLQRIRVDSNLLETLSEICPNLESLEFHPSNWRYINNRPEVLRRWPKINLPQWVHTSPAKVVLPHGHVTQLLCRGATVTVVDEIVASLPHLEVLMLQGPGRVDVGDLLPMLHRRCPRLSRLCFDNMTLDISNDGQKPESQVNSMRDLSVLNVDVEKPAALQFVAEHYPRLRNVTLSVRWFVRENQQNLRRLAHRATVAFSNCSDCIESFELCYVTAHLAPPPLFYLSMRNESQLRVLQLRQFALSVSVFFSIVSRPFPMLEELDLTADWTYIGYARHMTTLYRSYGGRLKRLRLHQQSLETHEYSSLPSFSLHNVLSVMEKLEELTLRRFQVVSDMIPLGHENEEAVRACLRVRYPPHALKRLDLCDCLVHTDVLSMLTFRCESMDEITLRVPRFVPSMRDNRGEVRIDMFQTRVKLLQIECAQTCDYIMDSSSAIDIMGITQTERDDAYWARPSSKHYQFRSPGLGFASRWYKAEMRPHPWQSSMQAIQFSKLRKKAIERVLTYTCRKMIKGANPPFISDANPECSYIRFRCRKVDCLIWDTFRLFSY